MTYVPAERLALEDPVAVLPHVNPPVTLLSTEPQRFLEATVMLPRFRRTLSRAVVVEFVGEALSRLTFRFDHVDPVRFRLRACQGHLR